MDPPEVREDNDDVMMSEDEERRDESCQIRSEEEMRKETNKMSRDVDETRRSGVRRSKCQVCRYSPKFRFKHIQTCKSSNLQNSAVKTPL